VICPTCGKPQLSERPHLHAVVPATDPLDVQPIDDDYVVRRVVAVQCLLQIVIVAAIFIAGYLAAQS